MNLKRSIGLGMSVVMMFSSLYVYSAESVEDISPEQEGAVEYVLSELLESNEDSLISGQAVSEDKTALYSGSYINSEGTAEADIYAYKRPSVNTGDVIKAGEELNSLMIVPMAGIEKGSYVYITINNGSFDESLIDECQYIAAIDDVSGFNDLISEAEANGGSEEAYNNVLKVYVRDAASRWLPYNLEYIDSTTLKAELYPLSDRDAGCDNNPVTYGLPVYNIKLPAIAASDSGTVTVSVDKGNSSIESCENIVYAYNNGYVLSDSEYQKADNVRAEREINIEAGEPILFNEEENALIVKPLAGVDSGDSILIKISNGSFDENLIENCQYLSAADNTTTWKYLIDLAEAAGGSLRVYESLAKSHVADAQSREMPYNLVYIDSSTLKAELYPIMDSEVNKSSSSVACGVPIYRIPLPAVAGNEEGYTKVAVDGRNSSIESCGWYTIARINSEPEYSINDNITVDGKCTVTENSLISYNDTPASLVIKPVVGVGKSESVIIHIRNGSFDESLIEEYKYKTADNLSWDDMIGMAEAEGGSLDTYYNLSVRYVRDAGSRELPYNLEYIDSSTLRAELYPICDVDTNAEYSSVTDGIAVYNILLPAVAGTDLGEVEVAVDGNGSTIETSGWYEIAEVAVNIPTTTTTTESTTVVTTENVTEATTEITTADVTEATTEITTADVTEMTTESTTDNDAETATESTTAITTEGSTETTTKRVSSGGGGGGSSSVTVSSTSTTTTEATTETTTDDAETGTLTETVTETTTEETTYTLANSVRITIGSDKVVIGDESYEMDAVPYIQPGSNSTLVPLRFVAIAIAGGNVESADNSDNIVWDAVTKTAKIIFNDFNIEFTAGSNVMVINGVSQTMNNGVQAEITDGRMFVPFRALGEALGVGVEWEADTKTAIYNL